MGTGDTVRVLGAVKPADRAGRAAAIFLPASKPAIEEARGWLGYTAELRARFRGLALADGRDGGLLPGMALGDRTGLAADLEEAMQRTGLTHLTAVSGANCSYVVAFTFLGLRVLRLPRVPAGIGAVVSLVAFVLLVRPEPSVLRAAVMGAVGVAAVLSGRGRVSLTLLMVSVIVLLAVDPWLSVSFAFLLSVAATLGLVTAGPKVVDTLGLMMPRPAAQLLAIPLTAQLFCTPILVLIQPALPVYSLPANVLVSPVVPAITLVGMVAVLALVAAPLLAPALIATAQWGTRWVAGVAEVLAVAPAATLPWFPGAPGAAVAALGSVLLLLLMVRPESVLAGWRRAVTGTRPRPPDPPGPGTAGRPPARAGRRAVAIVLAVTLATLATITLVERRSTGSSTRWAITMCDVGQGDGMVIRTSTEHALVVDTGPDPDAMDRCLDALGIEVIDALVITHLHDDHYGGVEGALRGRTVSALYYSTGEDGLPRELSEAAARAGVEAERLTSATRIDLPPLRVDVLWPPGEARPVEENNASAVLTVVVPTAERPVTLLLTGDLEEDAAAELLAAVPSLRAGGVDILKIAHHGARNGGTGIIDAVSPALALISVGKDNDYGHPHPRILESLDRSGIAGARTDQLGSFTVGVTEGRIEVHRLR
ncbi:competence protein ComEC [Arthrobacter sp. MN05-02]|nr:competence protein ComEC [Arthrobacter sp. MN05-02]